MCYAKTHKRPTDEHFTNKWGEYVCAVPFTQTACTCSVSRQATDPSWIRWWSILRYTHLTDMCNGASPSFQKFSHLLGKPTIQLNHQPTTNKSVLAGIIMMIRSPTTKHTMPAIGKYYVMIWANRPQRLANKQNRSILRYYRRDSSSLTTAHTLSIQLVSYISV